MFKRILDITRKEQYQHFNLRQPKVSDSRVKIALYERRSGDQQSKTQNSYV